MTLKNFIYFLISISIILWATTIFFWLKGNSNYEPINVLVSAIISSLFSILGYYQSTKSLRPLVNNMDTKDLSTVLSDNFDLKELKEICFALGIDYDNLSGENKSIKIIEIIGYLKRRSELDKLILLIQKLRPNIVL